MARAWLHFHAARKGRGSGVQPRVSTGRSIHAVPSITPSPREGIEVGPRLRVRTPFQSRWPRPTRGPPIRGRSGAALGDVARTHLPMSARGACFRGVSRRMSAMALREGSNRRPPPSPANYPHVGIITPRRSGRSPLHEYLEHFGRGDLGLAIEVGAVVVLPLPVAIDLALVNDALLVLDQLRRFAVINRAKSFSWENPSAPLRELSGGEITSRQSHAHSPILIIAPSKF